MSTCHALTLGSSITRSLVPITCVKVLLMSLVLFLTYSLRLELSEEVCEVIWVRKPVLSTGMVLSLVVNVVPDNAVTQA